MNALQVAAAVLAKASALDSTMPQPNHLTMHAWAEHLYGVDMQEALAAVVAHYTTSAERIMPKDLLAHVKAARRDNGARSVLAALPAKADPDAAERHRQIVRSIWGERRSDTPPPAEDPALDVACPFCEAAPSSACKRPTRRGPVPRTPHPARIAAARKVPA